MDNSSDDDNDNDNSDEVFLIIQRIWWNKREIMIYHLALQMKRMSMILLEIFDFYINKYF